MRDNVTLCGVLLVVGNTFYLDFVERFMTVSFFKALSAKVQVPSEHSNTSESVGDETSHEESVLQELKMAMAQVK